MRRLLSGARLGNEKRSQVERVVRELDRAHVALVVPCRTLETGLFQRGTHRRVDAVTAKVILDRMIRPIKNLDAGPGNEPHDVLLAHERARESTDRKACRVWVGLFVIGLPESQHLPYIVHDYVLEPSSGADEWDPFLARPLDRPQRPLHILVGTGGGDEEARIPA